MFSERRAAALAVPLLCLLWAGCSRDREGIRRVAVLRFENLSGETSLDWMGRGLAEVVSAQMSGEPRVFAIPATTLHRADAALGARPLTAPGVSSERQQALLSGAGRIVYGYFSTTGGQLRVDAMERDPSSGKVVRSVSVSVPQEQGIFPAADALSRQLVRTVRSYSTGNQEALRRYVAALEEGPQASATHLPGAVQADPNFGPAYVMWLQMAASRGDASEVERVLTMIRSRGEGIPPVDRARIDLEVARLRGDPAMLENALRSLARFYPADPGLFRNLGDLVMQRREYRKAAEYLERAAILQPEDAATLNVLGYNQAYAGDLPAATRTLRRYERVRPNEPNPLDSLGDVHFIAGRFGEAEQFYLKAYERDPNFFEGGAGLKAAHARLMTGDVAGASTLFQRYLESRRKAGDPLAPFRDAEWAWLTGNRRAAISRLEVFASQANPAAGRESASRAWSQLALWRLMMGERERAGEDARRAMAAAGPSSVALAHVATFLSEPETNASEWAVRAERIFPDPRQNAVKEFALAYALLLSGNFAQATPMLRDIYNRWNPSADPGVPALLAWAQTATGKTADAIPLLKLNPVPQSSGLMPFLPLYFPRLFYLRGAVLEKQGFPQEAKESYGIFLKLSGSDPLRFGEEQRARQAMK